MIFFAYLCWTFLGSFLIIVQRLNFPEKEKIIFQFDRKLLTN